MDNTLYKQLHESINKIMGDSKKQQQQQQPQPPPSPPPEAGGAGGGAGGGATAAGGDIERGYLHQCTFRCAVEVICCVCQGEALVFAVYLWVRWSSSSCLPPECPKTHRFALSSALVE
jgi:hypothetical protein